MAVICKVVSGFASNVASAPDREQAAQDMHRRQKKVCRRMGGDGENVEKPAKKARTAAAAFIQKLDNQVLRQGIQRSIR